MKADAFAPAKINLTLHVTGRRDDGYHLLDSLVVFAGMGDRLWLKDAAQMSLRVTGRFASGVPQDRRNLVWQAADLLGAKMAIRLEKNLPHGAGIGGGSADAAAVMRHLLAQRQPGDDAIGLAATLGADVPVCLSQAPQRMRGIGDVLAPCGPVPDCDLVLVNPGFAVPTREVFSALIETENPPMNEVYTGASAKDFAAWLRDQRNDLERPAVARFPRIAAVLDALGDAMLCRMSGSGGTCFGLYPSSAAAEAAAAAIAERHPDWWVQATRLVGPS